MNFEMKIADVFILSSGYTIFVGEVIGTHDLIKSGQKVNLFIDGLSRQCFETHGEWKANTNSPQGYRSLSTLESVDLTSEFVKNHRCTLISV
ncbi:MAG: hypothetical protein HC930_11955 [Hydrococcus sp. SU_1_0]|nr:hypothetical protein [Hydrococcus sp. SU_1_0]